MTLNKTLFRQNSLNRIKNSSKHNQLYKNYLVNKKLFKLLKDTKGKKILFYYPIDFEADILKVLKYLRKKSDIYVPFMVKESFKMVPFRLPLEKKKFGIYEAKDTLKSIKNIDIAIVPVVGVDGNLQRVGFGKGMYDRFFAKLRKRPYIIFTQLEFCYTREFICDEYDIACDIFITPKKDVKIAVKKKI